MALPVYTLFHFLNPLVVVDLDLPGVGAAGSETVCLDGTVVVLTSASKMGSAKIGFYFENWASITYCLGLKAAGTISTVVFEGFTGSAKFPFSANAITWKQAAGPEYPQANIKNTGLDLFHGEIQLVLLGT